MRHYYRRKDLQGFYLDSNTFLNDKVNALPFYDLSLVYHFYGYLLAKREFPDI